MPGGRHRPGAHQAGRSVGPRNALDAGKRTPESMDWARAKLSGSGMPRVDSRPASARSTTQPPFISVMKAGGRHAGLIEENAGIRDRGRGRRLGAPTENYGGRNHGRQSEAGF